MSEKLWKQRERKAARALGGKRSSIPGVRSPDGTADGYVVESKLRKKLPAWIVDGLATARGQASDYQLGLLVLHEKGARDDLVVLSLKDFKDRFGGVKHEDG